MRQTFKSIAMLSVCIFTANFCFAQEENQSGAAEQSTGGAIMITAEQDGAGGAPVISSFQVVGSPGDGGSYFLGTDIGMMGADPWSIVNNPQIQQELELVDEQKQQLRDLQKEYQKQLSERMQEFTKGGFDPESGKRIKDLFSEMRDTMQTRMGDILLPHQMDRLNQVSVQMEMRNRGDANALMGKRLAEMLGIDEEQKKRIEERSEEIKKKLEEKIAKLKDEAKQELLDELTSTQRKKLKELTGDKFEYKQTNWRDQIEKARRRAEKKSDDKEDDK